MSEQPILITKANGQTEPFDIQKLEYSLRQAKVTPGIMQQVTGHILQELDEGMTTREIYSHAFEVLHRIEKGAAIRYSLRRAIMDLGPTGFPFERFVAEIFKAKGYKVLTDQNVNGICVEHEVDVVAWKKTGDKKSLIMTEAKFHNQLGMKSDLKVVLYVNSRFDDLGKAVFSYDGEQYKLEEGWLVTNTKFTISAIKYAECQKMKAIGWNYPLDGNLHDLIEEAGLHPITCLRSLSDHDKKTLLAQDVLLCKSLMHNDPVLASLGLPQAHIETIKEEIRNVYEASAI